MTIGQGETSHPHRVLLIEDEQGIQEVLKLGLQLEGLEVCTADNGKAGLEVLSSMNPAPCAILLDLMMPVMNGWECAEILSKDPNYSNIPVILLTAYGNRANSVPARAIIKKPVDLDELLKTINNLCPTHTR